RPRPPACSASRSRLPPNATSAPSSASRRSLPPCPAGRKGSDMAADSSERFVLLNQLAEEFAARYRRGERPALQEYVDRHPELADDIREFFPAVVEMEQVKEDRHELPEPAAAGPLPPLERLGGYPIPRGIGHGGLGGGRRAQQGLPGPPVPPQG